MEDCVDSSARTVVQHNVIFCLPGVTFDGAHRTAVKRSRRYSVDFSHEYVVINAL